MCNLCIIPARGGSKRIPRKNIKLFHGKPIIAYSIELAVSSGLFSEVMVSTDDEEIAEIAIEYGAKVPFLRSEKNANDFATTLDVLNEVSNVYRDNGRNFEYLCCIYPTAVLAKSDDIKLGYLKLEEWEMVLPITKFSYPPQRSYIIDHDNKLKFVYPENENKRSQDLDSWFHDAGQWYWYKVNKLTKGLNNMKKGYIEIPNIQVQDIDNNEDWILAELKYKLMYNN
jgi:pseudaminic acid cytidylyltransferase